MQDKLRKAYEGGATIRECMVIAGKSYGATHRLLTQTGVELRPRGGERWKNADHNPTS